MSCSPATVIPSRALRRERVFAELDERLAGVDGTVARIALELVCDIRELTSRANELEREITRIVRDLAPALLALEAAAALSAAKIVGEAAGATRFKSKAAFARWNGTAPVPAWSGATRFRLSRGGNRQINAALHRIALTQCRGIGPGRAYVDARLPAATARPKRCACSAVASPTTFPPPPRRRRTRRGHIERHSNCRLT